MYNGHKNWNHWNVSLWLFNDEGMYRFMTDTVNQARTLDDAAKEILDYLLSWGDSATPDGAPYTFTSIRAALVGWDQ
jgi:hypothetical protein